MQREVVPVEEQTSEHDGTHSGGAFGREVERREVERREVSGVAGVRRAGSIAMRASGSIPSIGASA